MSTPSDSAKNPETTELDAAFIPPPDAVEKESSPVFDSVVEDESIVTPEVAKSYKLDVNKALDRETQDGPGDEDPGPSDWQGYATEGVEVEDD